VMTTAFASTALTYAAYGAVAYGAYTAYDSMTDNGSPDIPDPVEPEAPVEEGDEGIRKGEMDRLNKRRAIGQAFLTKGQDRGTGQTLGELSETLG
ncbi:unnamed protein product, partial [marine sediment metagenome]